VGLSSGIQGCFLCVSFGELRGESVGKIFLEGEDAEVDCTPKKATINKMFCEPPFQVKVLSMSSPTCMSVRPVNFDEAAYEMELELANVYNELPIGGLGTFDIPAGTACAVKWSSKWRRAVVVSRMEEETGLVNIVTIRLVDLGFTVTTDVMNLRHLTPQFLSCPALCIICHLYDLKHWAGKQWLEADLLKMKSMIPEDCPVFLRRRGPPEQNLQGGYYSLPVDLYWDEVKRPDPFMPEIVTEKSFTKLVALEFGVTSSMADLDDTIEDEENEEDVDDMDNQVSGKEFSDVEPLKDTENFHWQDPELPSDSQFSARGTFVDESGQIYIQLHSQRKTVRVLRRLLIEKFSNTESVLCKELKPSQECCVRWRDGCWYRARFIQYLDTGMEQKRCLVVLVDYGNMYQVLMRDVRTEIYAEKIPIQCLRLVLAGVEPVGGTWSQQCLDLIQEKINYAKLEGNNKLSVTIVKNSTSLPLLVNICEKSIEGVMVDLSQILFMIFPQDVIKVKHLKPTPSPLCALNNITSWSWGCVPPGHYIEKNPFMLLSPHYCPDNSKHKVIIPSIDWEKAEVWKGQKLQVELPDDNIYTYNKVHLVPVAPSNNYLSTLATQHQCLFTSMQAVCESNPPVLQPRLRLPVAAKWGEDGWYRAVVDGFNEKAILVEFVDYGTRSWVSDSMNVRELPEEWMNLPAIAVPVHLEIQAVENDDIVASVIKECLLTWENDMWLKVTRIDDRGKVWGHLVDKYEEYVYKLLVKEGVIKLK